MKKDFFEKRSVTLTFAIIAVLGSFIFLDKKITGNAILNNNFINPLSIISALLIVCAIILALYSLNKK